MLGAWLRSISSVKAVALKLLVSWSFIRGSLSSAADRVLSGLRWVFIVLRPGARRHLISSGRRNSPTLPTRHGPGMKEKSCVKESKACGLLMNENR
jgi:hypothetical protein